MVTLTIDNKEVQVEPGTTILRAAEKLGIFIPHYCYHPSLSIAGSCRMCLVEVEGAPREAIACNQPVGEGMVVHTDSERVKRAREIVLEFLLLNHPLDCPVCDKAGECLLQDYSFNYGTSHSRFDEQKRVPPFKDLGPNIMLATTRCILCTRCTRFMDEIAGDAQLTVVNRGYHNQIEVAKNTRLDHPLAGNVVDICPVGCLLDKNFIHRTRVWHLEATPSVCGECSAGCNTLIDSHRDEIYRIRPRFNAEVNDHWICDTGRYAYKKYAAVERLVSAHRREDGSLVETDLKEALEEINNRFGKYTKTADSIAVLISPYAVNENVFAVKHAFKELMNSHSVTGLFRRPAGEDREFRSGFVIKGDTFPNQAGLQYILGLEQPDYGAQSVVEKIKSGAIKAAYVIHNDLSEISEDLLDTLKKLDFLVVEEITASPLTAVADIVLPGKLHFEDSGTYMNYRKRLQLLERAVMGPAGTLSTWEIMEELSALKNNRFKWTSAGGLFLMMARIYPDFEGLSHFRMDKAGHLPGQKTAVEEQVES
ncbi:2Fe-2S iron-sulfur cluster-binding protein [candidate division KSB1 bacterium]